MPKYSAAAWAGAVGGSAFIGGVEAVWSFEECEKSLFSWVPQQRPQTNFSVISELHTGDGDSARGVARVSGLSIE